MNITAWRKELIDSRRLAAIPIMTHPGIEALGCSVRQAITDGQIQAHAIVYLADQYPTSAACSIMDLTVEAEAFGAEIIFPEDEIASVVGRLLEKPSDIEKLEVPPLNSGRIPEFLKANIIARRQVIDRPFFAGCIGPFSLAGRLYGMSELMMLLYEDAQAAHLLLQKCAEFIKRYCLAIKATGVDGVLMAEPAAGLLSLEDCRTYSTYYVRQIVNAVDEDEFLLVLHNCGDTGHCTQAMVETGAKAFHFGNKCKMEDVVKIVPGDCLALGNLDPVSVFKDGTIDEIKSLTQALVKLHESYPNLVISSGCDTPPGTPLTNISSFFEALC